ncbi:MAG: acyl-CoA thioesterase [Syntrophaceae bacterium]|nr:acyl-CoA thioesterase [Syntrophaceae bacterium]
MNSTPARIQTLYADTDAMGIVYHGNYVRWFEIGREALFRKMGIRYRDVEEAGFNLPVTRFYCHYLLPMRYDDEVLIETEIAYVKRASLKFSYRIRLAGQEEPRTLGYTVHACTDREGKLTRIPLMIAEKIAAFYHP